MERGDLADARAFAEKLHAFDQRFTSTRQGDIDRTDRVFSRSAIGPGEAGCCDCIIRTGSLSHAFRHLPGTLFTDRAKLIQRFLLDTKARNLCGI